MKVTYFQHELKLRMKYICQCGHKMYRINSAYYTMSQFNRYTEEACIANRNYEVFKQVRECPKCGTRIKPVLTAEQEKQCEVWLEIYKADEVRIKGATP